MVLTFEQRVKGYALKIEYLQENMIQMYRTIYGNKVNIDTDTEIGLSISYGSNIMCYQFKKEGHKDYQCPDKHNDDNNYSDRSKNISNRGSSRGIRKSNGSFSHCRKEGHNNVEICPVTTS